MKSHVSSVSFGTGGPPIFVTFEDLNKGSFPKPLIAGSPPCGTHCRGFLEGVELSMVLESERGIDDGLTSFPTPPTRGRPYLLVRESARGANEEGEE